MSIDQSVVFAVLIVTLVLFITEKWRYDVVAFMALMAVTLTGIVPADQAFIGFGHAAAITVAAVLVLSRALRNSGVIDLLAGWTSRRSQELLKQGNWAAYGEELKKVEGLLKEMQKVP